jgi:hypothetical protein
MIGSPEVNARSAAPDVAITAAGTYAHRCGRADRGVLSQPSRAHPAANARRAAPTMTASEAAGRTANVSAAAATTPVTMEATMTRPSGPVDGAAVPVTGVSVGADVVMRVSPGHLVLGG